MPLSRLRNRTHVQRPSAAQLGAPPRLAEAIGAFDAESPREPHEEDAVWEAARLVNRHVGVADSDLCARGRTPEETLVWLYGHLVSWGQESVVDDQPIVKGMLRRLRDRRVLAFERAVPQWLRGL